MPTLTLLTSPSGIQSHVDRFLVDQGIVERKDVNDIANIYWDQDGNLRCGKSSRDRDAEVLELLSGDAIDETEEARVWMIVPSRWVRHWLLFAHLKISTDSPGPINMDSLLQKDDAAEGGWRPKKTLLPPGKGAVAAEKEARAAGIVPDSSPSSPSSAAAAASASAINKKSKNSSKAAKELAEADFPGHYRRISLEAWTKLVDMYGLTEPKFAMAVRGTPYDDISRWRVFKNPKNIDASLLPVGDGKHMPRPEAAPAKKAGAVEAILSFFGGSSQK